MNSMQQNIQAQTVRVEVYRTQLLAVIADAEKRFHTAWVKLGHRAIAAGRLLYPHELT